MNYGMIYTGFHSPGFSGGVLRRVFLPILFIFIAFPCRGESFFCFFLSASWDILFESALSYETDYLYDGMFGLGAEYSFLFGEKEIPEKKVSRYGMITPEMCAEYSPFSNQLRLQTGLNLGKLFIGFLMFYDYYVGAAGIFLRDFNHDVNALGVAPEIGLDLGIFFIRYGLQLRYELYTNSRYNRFVLSVRFGIL